MTATTSKRKKYVREMKPTWWKKLDFTNFILRVKPLQFQHFGSV